jgi:hypothetical protein
MARLSIIQDNLELPLEQSVMPYTKLSISSPFRGIQNLDSPPTKPSAQMDLFQGSNGICSEVVLYPIESTLHFYDSRIFEDHNMNQLNC